jgi:hypothetical protein
VIASLHHHAWLICLFNCLCLPRISLTNHYVSRICKEIQNVLLKT